MLISLDKASDSHNKETINVQQKKKSSVSHGNSLRERERKRGGDEREREQGRWCLVREKEDGSGINDGSERRRKERHE